MVVFLLLGIFFFETLAKIYTKELKETVLKGVELKLCFIGEVVLNPQKVFVEVCKGTDKGKSEKELIFLKLVDPKNSV